jgi:cytochrome b561
MPARPDSGRYSGLSIALHWLMAAIIVTAFVLALVINAFPKDMKPLVVETHKALGLAVLALLVLRFAWRLLSPPPPLTGVTPVVQRLSQFGHLGLYLLMIAVPVVGIVYSFWRGQTLHFGLFDIASPFAADRAMSRQFREIHEFAAYALIGLAGLHAVAALWHHYVKRDGVLRRMLPA